MTCQYLPRTSSTFQILHRLRCPECRAARTADALLQKEIEAVRSAPAPTDGLEETLAALGLTGTPTVRREQTPMARRAIRRRRRLRLALPAGSFSVAWVLAAGAWYGYYSNISPRIVLPTVALPANNGYDRFVRAVGQVRDVKSVDSAADRLWSERTIQLAKDFMPAAASQDSRNRATGYRIISAAASNRPGLNPKSGTAPGRSDASVLVSAVLDLDSLSRYLVYENRDALRSVREGLSLPYLAPPGWDSHVANERLSEHLSTFRGLARLLALEARVRASDGDVSGAATSGLDTVQLGVTISRGMGNPWPSASLGSACERIGRKSLWNAMPGLNAVQARAAAQRLEALQRRRIGFDEFLQQEEWAELALLRQGFRYPNWRRWALGYSDGPAPTYVDAGIGVSGTWPYLYLCSKRSVVSNYTRYMSQVITDARLPYNRTCIANGEGVSDAFTKELAPEPGTLRQARAKREMDGEAATSLLMTTLALRAYHLEHSAYPADLGRLVPGYLSVVPRDPFAAPGHELRYRRDGGSYVLYSIGPDGVDDGGNMYEAPKEHSASHGDDILIDGKYLGDMVAKPGVDL